MQSGTVKTFNSERGFGFITRDAGGTDIFFHVDQVDESIEELFRGQRVSFEEGLSPRSGRPEARDVRIVQWLSPLCYIGNTSTRPVGRCPDNVTYTEASRCVVLDTAKPAAVLE